MSGKVANSKTTKAVKMKLTPEKTAEAVPELDGRLNRIRVLIGLALSALSAVLLTLAFPPYNLGLLIWVGFIPMLIAQHRVLPDKLSGLAGAVTIGGWLGVLLVPIFGGKSAVFVLIPLALGAIVYLVDKNKRAFHARTDYRWFVLEGVAGWVGLEMIRGLIPAIGTWAFVGYPLFSFPWLIQPLSLVGIFGLDLLIMLTNYVLAQAAFVLLDRRSVLADAAPPAGPPMIRSLCLLGVFLAAWVSLSLTLYARAPAEPDTVVVAAVQPNLPRAAHRDTQTSSQERLALLDQQTRVAAARGAQLVVWPEMALGFDPQLEYTAEIRALAAETGATIVVGYVLERDASFRNEATVLTPSGEFLGVYGKNHPMVASGEPKTATAGVYPVYDTPLGKLATIICFDAHFTDVSRRMGDGGAQLIANPSLFGPPIAALPYTQIVFRAVENRTAFIMADAGYNSAIVDPYGHLLSLSITPKGEAATLVAEVPLGSGNTLYARTGDWLGWLSLAGLIFFAVYMPVTLRKKASP